MSEPISDGAINGFPVSVLEHLEGLTVAIGPASNIEVTLPLSPAESSRATDQQRYRLAVLALHKVLLEESGSTADDWSLLDERRERIKEITGVDDATVTLMLIARARAKS
jgi:hypothetical protein